MLMCNSVALVILRLTYSGHYRQVVLLYRWSLTQVSLYFDGKTKSVLLIRGTYYQKRFMYCMYRRDQNEGYLLFRSVYYPR